MNKKQRILVLGDVHGGLRSMTQVLQRANFNFAKDKLIVLGDISDGWPEAAEALEFLIENVKNMVFVRGNHDQWLKEWLKSGRQPKIWTMQGGQATIASYERNPELKEKHLAFLKTTKQFYIDEENRVFVHGGVEKGQHPKDTDKQFLTWDRTIFEQGKDFVDEWEEVYVGHTSIYAYSHVPLLQGNVWFMDTGGGYEGVLSLMDIDSKEVWQSDPVSTLYPGYSHR